MKPAECNEKVTMQSYFLRNMSYFLALLMIKGRHCSDVRAVHATIWVFLCCSIVLSQEIRTSHDEVSVSLSVNETALLEASKYFSGPYSEVFLPQTTSASLLRNLIAEESFKSSTSIGDWKFGGSTSIQQTAYRKDIYFTIYSATSIELWELRSSDTRKLWKASTLSPVSRAEEVHHYTSPGFLYWASPHLLFLDLAETPLRLAAFEGITGVDSLGLCANINEALAVVQTHEGSRLLRYSLNFSALQAEPQGQEYRIAEPVVDVSCHEDWFALTPRAVYRLRPGGVERIHLPSSLGEYSRMKALPRSWAACGSNGVVVDHPDIFYTKPIGLQRVRDVLRLSTEGMIVLETDPKRFAVWNFNSQATEKVVDFLEVPYDDSVTDYSWIDNYSETSQATMVILRKTGQITVFSIRLGTTLLAVKGEAELYSFFLCAGDIVRFACLSVTVAPLADDSEILLKQQYSRTPLSQMNVTIPLDKNSLPSMIVLSDYISGSNMQFSVSFPSLPPFLRVEYSVKSSFYEVENVLQLKCEGMRLMCSYSESNKEQFVYYIPGLLRIYISIRGFFSFSTDLNVVACTATDSLLYVLADCNDSVCRLYALMGDSFVQEGEIELLPSDLVGMRTINQDLLVVTKRGVVCWSLDTKQWTRLNSTLTDELLDVWADDSNLALLSLGAVEFFTIQNEAFIRVATAALPVHIRKVIYASNYLIAQSGDELMTVFFVTNAYQLVELYTLDMSSPVLSFAAYKHIAAVRCRDFIQVIDAMASKREAKVYRIPTYSAESHVFLDSIALIEIDCSGDILIRRYWPLFQVSKTALHLVVTAEELFEGPLCFAGQLRVESSDAPAHVVVLNVTLLNEGQLITVRDFPESLEVPWDSEYSLALSPLAIGQDLRFEVQAGISVEVTNAVTVTHAIPINWPHTFILAVPSLHGIVSFQLDKIMVAHYACENGSCQIVRKHLTELSSLEFSYIASCELLLRVETTLYFLIAGLMRNDVGHVTQILTINLETDRIELGEVLPWTFSAHKYHILQENQHLFHIFFPGLLFVHCTFQWTPKQDSLVCSEVAVESLRNVIAITSEQVGERVWRVYALSAFYELFEFELSAELVFLRMLLQSVLFGMSPKSVSIVGKTVFIASDTVLKVLSFPDFQLVREISLHGAKTSAYSLTSWTGAQTSDTQLVALQKSLAKILLLSLSVPPLSEVLAKLPHKNFAFTSPTSVMYCSAITLFILEVSESRLILRSNASRSDNVTTDVVLRVSNNFSSVQSNPIRVTRYARKKHWWFVAAAVAVGVLFACIGKRKKREAAREIEMEDQSLVAQRSN